MPSLFYLTQSLLLLLLFPLHAHASVLKRGNDDPFYQPPAHWRSKQPGDILRWRKIEPKFIGGDFNVAEAYQLLYRTSQDTPDEPQHTVTTAFVPHNAKKDTLLVGSTAQDANGQQCTPSAGYTYNSETNFVFWLDETFFSPIPSRGLHYDNPRQGRSKERLCCRPDGGLHDLGFDSCDSEFQ